MLAEFFFALAMLWWEGLRALKIDISSLPPPPPPAVQLPAAPLRASLIVVVHTTIPLNELRDSSAGVQTAARCAYVCAIVCIYNPWSRHILR